MAMTTCACASAAAARAATVAITGGASAAPSPLPSRAVASVSPRLSLVFPTSKSSPLSRARSLAAITGTAAISLRRRSAAIATQQRSAVIVRAQADDSMSELTEQAEQVWKDLQAKWEAVEDKTTVGVYAGGAVFGLWLLSSIAGAINSIPLLPKLLELIGLGYTSWFIYRYLLFKNTREELLEDIEELKAKVTGAYESEALSLSPSSSNAGVVSPSKEEKKDEVVV